MKKFIGRLVLLVCSAYLVVFGLHFVSSKLKTFSGMTNSLPTIASPQGGSVVSPNPVQAIEPSSLPVKAGQKAFLSAPFESKSVTIGGLKEWGPRVTIGCENGDGVFLVPDGENGFKKVKSFSYTNGDTMPQTQGIFGVWSFASDQDVTVLYKANY